MINERKARERQARDALILDVAKSILAKGGLTALTMQAIADETQYSKGTIYQHYRSKEDVLAALVLNCGYRLLALTQRALSYSGSLRSKISLVSAAFFKVSETDPITSSLVFTVKSPDFLQKIAHEHAVEQNNIDDAIFKAVVTSIREHSNFSEQSIMDLAFGWWSMNWGVQAVMGSGWDMERLGFTEPMDYYYRSLSRFLDGQGLDEDPLCKNWQQVIELSNIVFRDLKN